MSLPPPNAATVRVLRAAALMLMGCSKSGIRRELGVHNGTTNQLLARQSVIDRVAECGGVPAFLAIYLDQAMCDRIHASMRRYGSPIRARQLGDDAD